MATAVMDSYSHLLTDSVSLGKIWHISAECNQDGGYRFLQPSPCLPCRSDWSRNASQQSHVSHHEAPGGKGSALAIYSLCQGRKWAEKLESEVVLAEEHKRQRDEAEELDRQARSNNKRQRFPTGMLFDQKYRDEHLQELADRKEAEKQAREAKRRLAKAKGKEKAPDLAETSEAGPSNSVPEE